MNKILTWVLFLEDLDEHVLFYLFHDLKILCTFESWFLVSLNWKIKPCNPGLERRMLMGWLGWWGMEALRPKPFQDAMNLQLRHCKWHNNLGRSAVGNPSRSVLVQVISTWNPARQSESDFPGSSDDWAMADTGLSFALGYRERWAIRSSVLHPSARRRLPSWWTGMKLTTDWYWRNAPNLKLKWGKDSESNRTASDLIYDRCASSLEYRAGLFLQVKF